MSNDYYHKEMYEQPRYFTSPMVLQQPGYMVNQPYYNYNYDTYYHHNNNGTGPGAGASAPGAQPQGQQPQAQVNGQLGGVNGQISQGQPPSHIYQHGGQQGAPHLQGQGQGQGQAQAQVQVQAHPQSQGSTSAVHSAGSSHPPHPLAPQPPVIAQNPSQIQPQSQEQTPQTTPNKDIIYSNYPERLQQVIPTPPLSRAPTRPDITFDLSSKRVKRKSKFSQSQDDLIVSLKKKGKSWVEIAEISGVGSYLAARNRFQVIVGQQGNNNSGSWNLEDKANLQNLLDIGEIEKWKFISFELNKASNKNFTDIDCRELIKLMFWSNPQSFGVNEDTIKECIKEKKITEKSIEQRNHAVKKEGKDDNKLNGNFGLPPFRDAYGYPKNYNYQ